MHSPDVLVLLSCALAGKVGGNERTSSSQSPSLSSIPSLQANIANEVFVVKR